ncbi:FAM63A-like protein [Choanephora cucurbitarum]|nr:FAM63A-like protein [Choanephora cucurbitarum]
MEAALSKDFEGLSLSPNEQIPTKEEEEHTPVPTEPSGLIFAEEYLVKTIQWKDKPVQIITQNENGPCPLVAICNVLFLRGDLSIQPPDREVVTFEYLVERLGDYLLNQAPSEERPKAPLERQTTSEFVLTYRHNLDSAFSMLPHLQRGLDVNVQFDGIRGFEPTAELAMFDLFHADLVHGWVADPQDRDTYQALVHRGMSYNQAVEAVVQTDELSGTSPIGKEEEQKLHEGFLVSEFLKDTATQLTYFGLELLLDSIPKDSLCVLFRNNHFSTVYRHPTSGLYMLVTDSGLLNQQSIVWESLNDIDQGSSAFFDSQFRPPVVHDHPYVATKNPDTDLDHAIAISLQQHDIPITPQEQAPSKPISSTPKHGSRKHSCIIS